METKTLGRLHRNQPHHFSHGEPTFRGTRIRVEDVLEQIASGMAYEAIIEEWRGTLIRDAIAEAVRVSHLMPFPFDDLSTTKVRPTVCLIRSHLSTSPRYYSFYQQPNTNQSTANRPDTKEVPRN